MPTLLAVVLGVLVVAFPGVVRQGGGRTRIVLWSADEAAIDAVLAGQSTTLASLDGIPDVAFDFYDVDAAGPAAIRAQLNDRGPLDRHGKHFDARTRWSYRWHWDPASDGGCGVANAQVRFSARITLPHLASAGALDPESARAWRAYMTALVLHEAGHVRNGYDGYDDVANAVRSSSCAQANAAGDEAIARLTRVDERYDAATRHGALDGATFG